MTIMGSAAYRTVVVSVLALSAAACESTIATGLDETQANAVVVALDERGIGAGKDAIGTGEDATYDVRVASDDVARALSVLNATDLPRAREPGIAEVFGEGSLVPTATEERARYVAAMGGELARSIEAIDGVLDARVHVALPERRDFALDEERPRPRASVLIKHRPGRAPYDAREIAALVAGAVPEMLPEDVAIVAVEAPAARGELASLVRIGPIAVSHGSAPILKSVLGVSLGLHAVLAIALLVLVLRRRRDANAPRETAGTEPA
jgi:type III secretion protein J